MQDSRKIRLVYILSASHSGSTLLSMLLGAHPDVSTVGELKVTSLGDRERYLCSCQKRIKKCPFWSGISQDMRRRGIDFDITNAGTDIRSGTDWYVKKMLSPMHRGLIIEKLRDIALNLSPAWRAHLKKVQFINTNLIQCILARTGKDIIVDSSKIGIRLKYLLQNPLFDVLIIRLIRDGRSVALTYMDPAQYADSIDPQFRGGGTGNNRESERLSMAEAAYEWRRANEEALAILKYVDRSRWIEVRYEDLCSDVKKTLQQIFIFIGVDPKKAIADFRTVEQHIVGNGMRLDSDSQIRFDEKWRTVLKTADLDSFNSIAGNMNGNFGYK